MMWSSWSLLLWIHGGFSLSLSQSSHAFSSLFSFLGNWIRRFGFLEGEPNGSVLDYGRRMKRKITRGVYLDPLLWVQSFSPASLKFMCTFGAISPLQRLPSRRDQPEKTKNTFF